MPDAAACPDTHAIADPLALTEVEWFAFVAASMALQEVLEAYAREEEDA